MSSIISLKPVDRRKTFSIKIEPDLHDALTSVLQVFETAGYVVRTDDVMENSLRRHIKKMLTDAHKEKLLSSEELDQLNNICAQISIKRPG